MRGALMTVRYSRGNGHMKIRLLLLFLITCAVLFAQDYPTKLVRMIEPFGAGGGHLDAAGFHSRETENVVRRPVRAD